MEKKLLLFVFLGMSILKTPAQTVTDIDGNVYHTITIGTQVWMVENLNVTHYQNGDPVTNVTDDNQWFNLATPAYCDYENLPANSIIYGRIYNHFAVADSRKISPAGWHVPSDDEWRTLTDYLTNNGYGYGGSGPTIAKSMASQSGWGTSSQAGTVGNDQASNNSSGFTALPGGGRFTSGGFFYIGIEAFWWCSTEDTPTSAFCRGIYSTGSACGRGTYDKVRGLSVRCISDSGVPTNDIENKIEIKFDIYPNPAEEKIFITISEKEDINLTICNLAGACVLKRELTNDRNEIDISSLLKGIYVVKVSGAGWAEQKKLVKL